MDIAHTCCVTGHRKIAAEKLPFVRERLQHEVMRAIGEGYNHFISGFAAGTDLIFAEIVSEQKAFYPITLEAAIPYEGRMKTPDKTFQRLIKQCDAVKILAKEYSLECYRCRNRYMVDASSLVITVYDGRKSGGTVGTVAYARATGHKMREIRL